MKRFPLRLSVSAVMVLLGLSHVLAQYSIDWSKIGGGGTSTHGQFAVSGTIGQPDASGPMTNGSYSVPSRW